MTKGRLILLILIALTVAAFFAFDLGRFFSLDFFKSQRAAIEAFRREHPLVTIDAMGCQHAIAEQIVSPCAGNMSWGSKATRATSKRRLRTSSPWPRRPTSPA